MNEQRSTNRHHNPKLYKSTSDRMIDGVCSGIAEYLGIDPSVVRLTLVAFTILSFGAGIIFYVVGMIVMPLKPANPSEPAEEGRSSSRKKSDAGVTTGIVILFIGIILLLHHNVLIPWFGIFDLHLIGRLALPIILILIGSVLLMGREKESQKEDKMGEPSQAGEPLRQQAESGDMKKLFRSIHDVKVAGVCGGLAEYLKMDSTLVRLAVVLLTLASFGMGLILYFACALVIPKENM